MKGISLSWAVAVVALIVAGCGGSGTSSSSTSSSAAPATQAATPPSGQGHAVDGVVAGSYEDWCEEHQVPETQCTRCDASLIPAFKAANDWDEEHGLPMSQCTIHDPNLKIVRPPKPEGK
jgi:hypothetical protein